jgi:lipopolysaccharide transport system permease protein
MSNITVVRPPGRLNMPRWSDLWAGREILVRLAQRDIILRYRQTFFGITWVIVQPLVSAAVFTIVFSQVANIDTGEIPYFMFAMSGMLAWNLFAGALQRGANSLMQNYALIAKVFFPRLLVPFSAVASAVLDFLVGLGLGVALMIVYGVNPGWQVLWLPVWALAAALLGTAVGIFSSALMVFYHDVQYVLPWVTQILIYAAPVAYPVAEMPEKLRWVLEANPLTWMLEAFRWSMLGTPAPPAWQLGALAGACVVLMGGAILYFQHFERGFADTI